MKSLLIIIVAILTIGTCNAQNSTDDLVGTWILEKHILDSGEECDNNKFTLKLNSDHSYTLDVNGYLTSGKWLIEGKKIKYYDSKLQNPQDGIVGDHSYKFKLDDNQLTQKEYVCSELGGTSTYKKL